MRCGASASGTSFFSTIHHPSLFLLAGELNGGGRLPLRPPYVLCIPLRAREVICTTDKPGKEEAATSTNTYEKQSCPIPSSRRPTELLFLYLFTYTVHIDISYFFNTFLTLFFNPFSFTICVYRLPLPRSVCAICHSVSPQSSLHVTGFTEYHFSGMIAMIRIFTQAQRPVPSSQQNRQRTG